MVLFGHAPNCQHRKSETDVVRKRRVGQQHGGRDHIVPCLLHLEICFGRASATYQEHKLVFRLDVDGVFVWSFANVHESSRHRALTSLHADTCGFVRGGFLFCLWKRVLAAVSSCSCLWQDFAIARNVSSNLLHVCLCTSRERHFEVRVKPFRCF